MRTFGPLAVLVSLVALSPAALAACPDQAAIDAYVADFVAARPSKGFTGPLTLADAECARKKLVQALPAVLGAVVGYKAGFTNEALQNDLRFPPPRMASCSPSPWWKAAQSSRPNSGPAPSTKRISLLS